VLAAETVNELIDVFHWHAGGFSISLGDAPKDFFNTMFWPTVVVIALRIMEARRVGARRPVEDG
jgi:hypothetical protein